MDCKRCADLLIVYKLAVKLHQNAEQSIALRNMKQDLGEHYTAALDETEQLRLARQDASDAFVEHWRQDHGKAAFSYAVTELTQQER